MGEDAFEGLLKMRHDVIIFGLKLIVSYEMGMMFHKAQTTQTGVMTHIPCIYA